MSKTIAWQSASESSSILNLPAGYFGMVLGTIGIGFSWRYAATIWPVSPWPGEGLMRWRR